MSDAIRAILDAVTDRVFACPKDKGRVGEANRAQGEAPAQERREGG